MMLQLTGKDEPVGLYQGFFGYPTEEMPCLMKQGYDLISVAGVIGRRESAPADVVNKWKYDYVYTGNGIAYDSQNNAKMVLDAVLLRKVNPDTKLTNNGALVLSSEQWGELHGDGVLYLSADKVNLAHANGFIKKNGVWQPENTFVGDVWEHLSREKDLKEYAEMVSKASNSNKVLRLWFDRNTYTSPVMRSLVLCGIGNCSDVNGNSLLNHYGVCLIGKKQSLL